VVEDSLDRKEVKIVGVGESYMGGLTNIEKRTRGVVVPMKIKNRKKDFFYLPHLERERGKSLEGWFSLGVRRILHTHTHTHTHTLNTQIQKSRRYQGHCSISYSAQVRFAQQGINQLQLWCLLSRK
jgi:hypothetical protein